MRSPHHRTTFVVVIVAVCAWLWWMILFRTPGIPVMSKIGFGALATAAGGVMLYLRIKQTWGD
jgi:hypothetical protein